MDDKTIAIMSFYKGVKIVLCGLKKTIAENEEQIKTFFRKHKHTVILHYSGDDKLYLKERR